MIFLTEFSQKTGMDPLPDFRKQIYKVGDGSKHVLIYDKQQKRYSGKWVDTLMQILINKHAIESKNTG
jgi:hypothetical protein